MVLLIARDFFWRVEAQVLKTSVEKMEEDRLPKGDDKSYKGERDRGERGERNDRGERSDRGEGGEASKAVEKRDYKSEKRGDDKKSVSSSGSAKSSSKRKIWERVIKEDSKEEPSFLQKCMRNKLIVACVVGILTSVLLVVLNPPMIQEKPTDAVSVPGRSVKKVLAWSALAAGLTLLIPMCLKWYGARASKQA